jgi:hypothetical protein
MAVHLCRSSANILLCRSKKDNVLSVATNTAVMIVLLEYGGPVMTEDLVSLPFGEVPC